MIKIHDHRYNPEAIKDYYPHDSPSRKPCIIIEWRRGDEKVIPFEDQEERDMHLSAMDEAMLIVKDGIVIDRGLDLPVIMGGGPFEGSGGSSILQ